MTKVSTEIDPIILLIVFGIVITGVRVGVKRVFGNQHMPRKTKVLVKTGKKDSYSTDIRKDTVKFNQMWDLISDKKADYGRYTIDEFYPSLEELGISVAREWEVLIGEGPSIICEGRATDIDNLIRNLQSEKFRHAKRRLKEYVENYESRILTFHIQKIKGYKSASYNIITD